MKTVFSIIVVITLLIIYASLVIFAILKIECGPVSAFNTQMSSSMTLIGGLVSALAIAELAVTKTGKPPVARILGTNPKPGKEKSLKIVTMIYMVIWIATGFGAFFFGYLINDPETLPPLAELGKAWLGIAVGAGYAYFNINP